MAETIHGDGLISGDRNEYLNIFCNFSYYIYTSQFHALMNIQLFNIFYCEKQNYLSFLLLKKYV